MRYSFVPVEHCDMCGSTDFRIRGLRLNTSQGMRPRSASGVAVTVKQCSACGLIFCDPRPVPLDLADHYGVPPESYWRTVPQSSPEYLARELAVVKRLLPFAPGMTALDIGAGTGAAMQSLEHAGFSTWGIEPSKPFYDYAVRHVDRERLSLATIEEATFPDASFDFITFGAVLEHLQSPSAALEKARRWLKPNGIIHAEVPSADHLISKIINAYYRMRGTNLVTHLSPMHAPFHLYEFTPRSFGRFEVAKHYYDVCSIYHLPKLLHPLLRWWMKRTDTGMQLIVYLR